MRGWWFDSCYSPQDMFEFDDKPNWHSLAAALRAGNPDAILAFAPGATRGIRWPMTSEADYLAGENHLFPIVNDGPWVEGRDGSRVRYHALTYLGQSWGSGDPRFADELPVAYAKHIIGHGSVYTFDVPIREEGFLDGRFEGQLRMIGNACRGTWSAISSPKAGESA